MRIATKIFNCFAKSGLITAVSLITLLTTLVVPFQAPTYTAYASPGEADLGITKTDSPDPVYIGDNITLAAVELRLPLTSPMAFYRAGIHFFFDSGTVYDYGQKLRDAKFHYGVGLGGFFRVAIIGVRLDLGFDLEGNVRFHYGSGFRF